MTTNKLTLKLSAEDVLLLRETIALYLQDRNIDVRVRSLQDETPSESSLKNLYELLDSENQDGEL